MAIVEAMAARTQRLAEAYRQDAVRQIDEMASSTATELDEAIHRAVHAVALMETSERLRELLAIAEGRRSPARWLDEGDGGVARE